MKRIFLSGLLSCMVIGQAQASDIAGSLIEGGLWSIIGAASTLGGCYLGSEIGERLSHHFEYRRPTVAGFYRDSLVGGLIGWCAAFAAKKLLTEDTTASTVGLTFGVAAVPVAILAALFARDYVPHDPMDDMTPEQRQQARQAFYASLTTPERVREVINMNTDTYFAMAIYLQLSEEQRGWVEPGVSAALQQHMSVMSTAWIH